MTLKNKLCWRVTLTLIGFVITSLSLNKELRSVHVLGMDVETSGSSFSRHGILSIGCSLQNELSNEQAFFQVNVALPDGREYEKECLENFWLKHPDAHQAVQLDAKVPEEAMAAFCHFLDRVEATYPDLFVVSDNPSFDIAWVNTYLSLYTHRKPLNYSGAGEYRMIWDSPSAQKTWMSLKTGDFDSRHGHIKKLGYTSKWQHDHTSLSDARRVADFFCQTRREMKMAVAAASKKVEVVPYSSEWSSMFEREASLLRGGMGDEFLNVHHVGSTSVPGLSAKPIIDIILELNGDPQSAADKLTTMGYKYKGEFNIPGRALFGRKEPYEVNLHVYEAGNPEVELNLNFRDFLRTSETHRLRYELLKMKLVHDPSAHEKVGGFTKYALGKNEFITAVIAEMGFSGVCPRFCTHYIEWDAYHTIRAQNAGAAVSKYSREDVVYSNPQHHHLVLYRGAEIVGALHINASRDDNVSVVEFSSIEDEGLLRMLKASLGKWSSSKGRQLVWE